MKQALYRVAQNDRIAKDVYEMTLVGDVSAVTRPGQFINIKLDGFFLRRPISVHEKLDGALSIIYKVVGEGTEAMSRLEQGAVLDVLTGLGNGYDTSESGPRPLLIGGGVGVPPLYELAKCLLREGKAPRAVLGFNSDGPMPMFRAVNDVAVTCGQFSFEERMGCGFGACMGCSCRTLTGNKRICREGPVLKREEIIWRT